MISIYRYLSNIKFSKTPTLSAGQGLPVFSTAVLKNVLIKICKIEDVLNRYCTSLGGVATLKHCDQQRDTEAQNSG